MFLFFLFVMAPGILYAWVMKNGGEIAEESPIYGHSMQIVATAGVLAYIIWLLSGIMKALA